LADKPFTVGFAAESENLLTYARAKLERKGLDLVIANNIATPGIGFNSDDNAVTLVDVAGSQELSQRSKSQLARELVKILADAMAKNN
jgi:phosphopantothenoylcysteine decarboxylase/phosphopantothenate--cysteine ligase